MFEEACHARRLSARGGAGCLPWALAVMAANWLVLSCGCWGSESVIKVVATTGMVADVVRQVGAERVSLTQLIRPGFDPHLYKPTTADVIALSKADVIFFNGLRLEGRMENLLKSLALAGRRVCQLSESLPPELLLKSEEFEGYADPHLWLDANLWAQTVPAVVVALSEADPAGQPVYEKNGAALRERLARLHDWCRQMAGQLPQNNRVVVTSHDAFRYFGRAYGFKVVGLQGMSTVSEASVANVASLANFIRQQGVRAIFVEGSVNPAAMRRVAEDAGVRIGGELFSDSLGQWGEMREGFDVGTYEGMIRYNMTTIVNALR